MNNKSKFKLSAKQNPNQIDHLGKKRIEILNQALPRHPQQILQGQGQVEDDEDAVNNINSTFTLKSINSSQYFSKLGKMVKKLFKMVVNVEKLLKMVENGDFLKFVKNGEMLKNVGENIKKIFALIFFYTLDIRNIIFNPKFYQHYLPSLIMIQYLFVLSFH